MHNARGDLLPEDKVERVRELMARHKHVGMIGDGVNDAPAMAVKALFLGLALTGHTSLWLAILADTGATLVVVANALRLLSVAGAGPRRGGKRS